MNQLPLSSNISRIYEQMKKSPTWFNSLGRSWKLKKSIYSIRIVKIKNKANKVVMVFKIKLQKRSVSSVWLQYITLVIPRFFNLRLVSNLTVQIVLFQKITQVICTDKNLSYPQIVSTFHSIIFCRNIERI